MHMKVEHETGRDHSSDFITKVSHISHSSDLGRFKTLISENASKTTIKEHGFSRWIPNLVAAFPFCKVSYDDCCRLKIPGVQAWGCQCSPGFPCAPFHGFSFCFPRGSSASFRSPSSPRSRGISRFSIELPPGSRSAFAFGLSSTEGFDAHRSSAACARRFSSICRTVSNCCSATDGGESRV